MANGSFRTISGISVAAVTAAEMRDVDRVAVEDVGLELVQMMENAGRTLGRRVLAVGEGPVLVVAGDGGNGGGGLACARHLANHDVEVEVVLDREPAALTGVTARQHGVVEEMGIPTVVGPGNVDREAEYGVLVDALIGYGLDGDVREPAATLIRRMNHRAAPTVSLDVPSGIDATTGETLGVAADPDAVVTLALPKTGLEGRDDPVVLADISVPHTVYDRLDIEYTNPFGRRHWVELVR